MVLEINYLNCKIELPMAAMTRVNVDQCGGFSLDVPKKIQGYEKVRNLWRSSKSGVCACKVHGNKCGDQY